MQAFIDRWGQFLKVECMDRITALGETHLNNLVRECVAHHHTRWPHQSLGNRSLPESCEPDPPVLPFPAAGVVCEERLGGLLKHFRRAARIAILRDHLMPIASAVRDRPQIGLRCPPPLRSAAVR
jgi:hypothetical protein